MPNTRSAEEENKAAAEKRANELVQEAAAVRRRFVVEPEPPDWECMEAARYCTSSLLRPLFHARLYLLLILAPQIPSL